MYIEIIKWGIQPLCVLYNMSDKRHTFGCEVALKTRRARTASLRVLRPRAEERPGGREQIKGDEEEEKERREEGGGVERAAPPNKEVCGGVCGIILVY